MWKNINISKNNINSYIGNSVLINMPHNSDYDGYSFYHPSKLVREGKHSNAISIGYTDEFKFKLKKYGKGKYNKYEVIAEEEINAEEFEEAFGIMNENIKAPQKKKIYETHKPEKLDVVEQEALEELKDE